MNDVKNENGNDRLIEIFKIMSFYDDYRWEFFKEDNLINFFKDNLDDDTKILTHWLCYITDRQMPFQRIWDIGGFVFSDLIVEMKKLKQQKDLNPIKHLLNPECDDSFIKVDTEKRKDNKVRYAFISKTAMNRNKILLQDDYSDYILKGGRVKFKSRFLPSDYYAILCTFVILVEKEYDFSFSKFIKKVYLEHKDKEDIIRRILYSLYLLTYYDIKQKKSDDISNFDANYTEAMIRKDNVTEILNNPNIFNEKYNKFIDKRDVFNQKRAWCSLRDYIKNPEIKKYFTNALNNVDLDDEDLKILFSDDTLAQLELPGDVWNNNSEFRKCILKDVKDKEGEEYKKSWSLNRILRDFHENNNIKIGYPEQFDISFDFVPRMCDSYKQNNCKWCPIYKIDNNKENNFNEVCLKNKDMYCPIILAGCNYKVLCKGETDCKLINIT